MGNDVSTPQNSQNLIHRGWRSLIDVRTTTIRRWRSLSDRPSDNPPLDPSPSQTTSIYNSGLQSISEGRVLASGNSPSMKRNESLRVAQNHKNSILRNEPPAMSPTSNHLTVDMNSARKLSTSSSTGSTSPRVKFDLPDSRTSHFFDDGSEPGPSYSPVLPSNGTATRRAPRAIDDFFSLAAVNNFQTTPTQSGHRNVTLAPTKSHNNHQTQTPRSGPVRLGKSATGNSYSAINNTGRTMANSSSGTGANQPPVSGHVDSRISGMNFEEDAYATDRLNFDKSDANPVNLAANSRLPTSSSPPHSSNLAELRRLSLAQRRQSNAQLANKMASTKRKAQKQPKLSTAQINLIRGIWTQLSNTKGPIFLGNSVMQRLFFKTPAVKDAYMKSKLSGNIANHDMLLKEHAKFVSNMVDQVVKSLEDIDSCAPMLEEIGRQHSKIVGFQPKFWNVFAEAFIDCTIEWGEKSKRVEDCRKGWALIVSFMVDKIKQGHYDARRNSHVQITAVAASM